MGNQQTQQRGEDSLSNSQDPHDNQTEIVKFARENSVKPVVSISEPLLVEESQQTPQKQEKPSTSSSPDSSPTKSDSSNSDSDNSLENAENFTFFPMSDLHLEFSPEIMKSDFFIRFPRKTEYLVLLGDMSDLEGLEDLPEEKRGVIAPDRRLFEFLKIQGEKGYKKIFFVCGNHEFYFGEYFDVLERIQKIFKELGSVFQDDEKFIFLHEMNPSAILDKSGNLVPKDSNEGVLRVIGTCNWSNVPEHHKYVVSLMLRDYSIISINRKKLEEMGKQFDLTLQPNRVPLDHDEKKLDIEDTTLLFKISMKQIEKEIEEAKEKGQVCLVLTHNSPVLLDGMTPTSAKNVEEQKYFEPKLNRIVEVAGLKHAFYNSLDEMFKKHQNIACWMYGHTHASYHNHNYFGAEIVNNTVGYYYDSKRYQNFNPNLKIKIPKSGEVALQKIATKRTKYEENLKKQDQFINLFKK